MNRHDKKRFNLAYVNNPTHKELTNEGNKRGENLAEYIGWVLERSVELGVHKLDDEGMGPFWEYRAFEKKKEIRDWARRAAAIYLEAPTEEDSDRLDELCEKANLEREEVIRWVEDDPFMHAIVESRQTLSGACIQWLPKFLLKNESNVSVREVRAAAKREGYSDSMLNRVKHEINADPLVPQIVSMKEGSEWRWVVQQPRLVD